MGGFPSHDAAGFLYTTAVQHPNSGSTTELCLVPLLRRYFNDNNKRLKDAVTRICFQGQRNTTQMALHTMQSGLQGNTGATSNVHPNVASSSHNASGTNTPTATPLAADTTFSLHGSVTDMHASGAVNTELGGNSNDETQRKVRAVQAYKSMEHILGEVEASFFTNTRVIYDSYDILKEKIDSMLAFREGRKDTEDIAASYCSKTNSVSPSLNTTGNAKPSKPQSAYPTPVDGVNAPASSNTKLSNSLQSTMECNQIPIMRPVPCAVCIIETDNSNRGKNIHGSGAKGGSSAFPLNFTPVGGGCGAGTPMVPEAYTINGIKFTEGVTVQGKKLHCIGYISCYSMECSDIIHHQQQEQLQSMLNAVVSTPTGGGNAACRNTVTSSASTPQGSSLFPGTPRNSAGAQACSSYHVPRLKTCSPKGCDVYLEIALENEDKLRFLLEPIIFLASMTFRSQFMTCSMWQKPFCSKTVEEIFYNNLQLLNVHVMLSPDRYHQLRCFYKQLLLIEFIDKHSFSERCIPGGNASTCTVDDPLTMCDAFRDSLTEECATEYGATGNRSADGASVECNSARAGQSNAAGQRRNRRGRRRAPQARSRLLPQDEVYRTNACRMPKFTLYELHTGQYGVEMVIDGGLIARFMKHVTETAAFETIKGNYVRCDLGPLMKERRHQLQSYHEALQDYLDQDEEDERLFGSEMIASTIRSWLKHGAAIEEQNRALLMSARKTSAAGPPGIQANAAVVYPVPPGAPPVMPLPGATPSVMMYAPGVGYMAVPQAMMVPNQQQQLQPPPQAQYVVNPITGQLQVVMTTPTMAAYHYGAAAMIGIQQPQYIYAQQQAHQPFPGGQNAAIAAAGPSYQYVMGPGGQIMAIPMAAATHPIQANPYNPAAYGQIASIQQPYYNMIAAQQSQQHQPMAMMTVCGNTTAMDVQQQQEDQQKQQQQQKGENQQEKQQHGFFAVSTSSSEAFETLSHSRVSAHATAPDNNPISNTENPSIYTSAPSIPAAPTDNSRNNKNIAYLMQQATVVPEGQPYAPGAAPLMTVCAPSVPFPVMNLYSSIPNNLHTPHDTVTATTASWATQPVPGSTAPLSAKADSHIDPSNTGTWFKPPSGNAGAFTRNTAPFHTNDDDDDDDDTVFALAAASAAMEKSRQDKQKVTNISSDDDDDGDDGAGYEAGQFIFPDY